MGAEHFRDPAFPVDPPQTGVDAWKYEDTMPPNWRVGTDRAFKFPASTVTPVQRQPAVPNVFQRFFAYLWGKGAENPKVRAPKRLYQAQGAQGPKKNGGTT